MVPSILSQIVFSITHLFALRWFQILLCNTNNSIWHIVKEFQVLLSITNNLIKNQSLVYTQLNDQTVLYLTT